MGITNTGENAEQLFIALTGFTQEGIKHNDPRGDARTGLRPIEEDFFFEVKRKNLNQVRPLKELPIASYDPDTNQWWVLPPWYVLHLCLDKKGQHVSDPLLCVGLGSITKKMFSEYKVPKEELGETILKYAKKYEGMTQLRKFVAQKKKQYEDQRSKNQEGLKNILEACRE